MEQRRPSFGRHLRGLKDQVDKPLAAILSLNTIAHTVGAAGAGAQAVAVFGDAYVGVISGILTFLILVVSEIIPKTLGALYWRRLAPGFVFLLRFTIWSMWPLVKLAQVLTALLARGKEDRMVHRDDVVALTGLGIREGVFGHFESRILKDLFRFRELLARDIMTPRTVVFALREDISVDEALADRKDVPFSRIPVFGRDLDDVTGFILKGDMLLQAARNKGATSLSTLKRALPVAPESMPLPALFDLLVCEQAEIALVVNEYGGTQGVVTLEDLVETLLGLEILDEDDRVSDMQELARRKWLARARKRGLFPGDFFEGKQVERPS
jgi:CBS domain containing-hemolysin-like protein